MWKSRRKDKILEEGFFYYLHEVPGLCEAPLGLPARQEYIASPKCPFVRLLKPHMLFH